MICKPCARGADVIAREGIALGWVSIARHQHDLCEGPTRCCCQHKVDLQVQGKAVRR